jgi:peptidoglycan/LPS O-acetylase OafA/YrhL
MRVLVGFRAVGPIRAALLMALVIGASFVYAACFMNSSRIHWYCYIAPWYRVCDFLVGVLAALIFLGISDWPIFRSLKVGPATLLEAAALLLLLGAVHWAPPIPLAIRFAAYFTPFMILPIVIFAFQRGLLARLLSGRCLMFLGEASFSFYMLHQLVMRFLPLGLHQWVLKRSGPIGVVIFLLSVILLLSCACYLLFERPMRTLVRRLLHWREPPQAAPPAPLIEEPRRLAA